MAYTSDDIQIFVPTYNREIMIQDTLASLLSQTVKGLDITILDNSDNDKTQKLIEENYPGIKYIKTPNGVRLANLTAARELASKPYLMMLHDDDILNPYYIENILKVVNNYENTVLVCARYNYFYNNDLPEISAGKKYSSDYYVFEDYKAFAISLWILSACWSAAVLKTSVFKKTSDLFEEYGKIHDWPIMIDIAKSGTAVIMKNDEMLYTRKHGGRDTDNDGSGLAFEQLLNWTRLFYNLTDAGRPAANKLWHAYAANVYRISRIQYKTFVSKAEKKKCPWHAYVLRLRKEGLYGDFIRQYNHRHKNKLLYIKMLPIKLKIKKNFISAYLKKAK
jgi:glycosyltransferase involved in cell wall biosynthesis